MNYYTATKPSHSFLLKLYAIAALLSIVLSLLSLCTNNPLELDALVYIKAAQIFHQANLTAAMQIYPWPFFSLLLATVHKYTSLSYVHAGYLINISLQVLITVNFIRVISALNANQKTIIIAAIVILCYPFLNKIRPYITRDFGYWAFALWSLLPLLHFYQTSLLRHALYWSLLLAIATLFRIEGAVFLLFTPLFFLLPDPQFPMKQRLIRTIKLYSWVSIAAIAYALWQQHATLHVHNTGRLLELVTSIKTGWQLAWQTIQAKSLLIGNTILTKISFDDAKIFLIGGLISLFLGLFITTMNPVYAFLSCYSIWQQLLPMSRNVRYLLGYLVSLNIVMLFLYLGRLFFLADRYLIFLNLLLMLWIPFSLEKLYNDWRQRQQQNTVRRWLFPAICLCGLLFITGGIIRFGYSKAYMTDAGHWLAQYTPSNSKLYSNSAQVLFYAQRLTPAGEINYLNPPDIALLSQPTFLAQYDYLALWLTKKDSIDIKSLLSALHSVKTFANKRGDKVVIFRVRR